MNQGSVFCIVVNPIELINSLEWFLLQGIDTSQVHLFFIKPGGGRAKDDQVEMIANMYRWKSKYTVDLQGMHFRDPMTYITNFNIVKISKVTSIKKKCNNVVSDIGPVSLVIFGRYPLAVHAANYANAERRIVIDGGTSTLQAYGAEQQDGQGSGAFTFLKKKLLQYGRRISFSLLGMRVNVAFGTDIFTAYHNILWPFGKIISNNYYYIAKDLRDRFVNNPSINNNINADILFIGEPICVREKITCEEYMELLQECYDTWFSGCSVVYVPHPKEDDEVVFAIEEKLSWEVKRVNFPIELEIMTWNHLPRKIWGFRTTALWNLYNMPFYKGNIASIYVKKLFQGKKRIEKIYEEFEKNGIPIYRI